MLMGSCSQTKIAPSDFEFMMDARTPAPGSTQHINIRINNLGKGHIEYYDTGRVNQYDTNDILIYEADQVVKAGEFDLKNNELSRLWGAINENRFFELTEDYRMAIGDSFAFILIKAEGRQDKVDNIGMEVPEIRALVEATDEIIPAGVDLEYGEGYAPKK